MFEPPQCGIHYYIITKVLTSSHKTKYIPKRVELVTSFEDRDNTSSDHQGTLEMLYNVFLRKLILIHKLINIHFC